MHSERRILTSAHMDREGEMIDPESLPAFVDRINACYLPITKNHDPRIPPLGRVISARLVKLEDGVDAVEGELEFLDPGDQLPPVDQSMREIPLEAPDTDEIEVGFDKGYGDDEGQAIVRDIGTIFGTTPQKKLKKSLDPVSILTIAGVFALGGIATGLLNKLGADTWDALKEKLKQAMERKKAGKGNLLIFEFYIFSNSHPIVGKVILTNPGGDDIEAFLGKGLNQVDRALTRLVDTDASLRQVVFEYSRNELRALYGIRKDAMPLFPWIELEECCL